MMEKLVAWLALLAVMVESTFGGYCPQGEPSYPQDVRAKGKEVDIFSDLTVEEMQGVLDYMYQRSGIRIASWERGSLNDSWIYLVEAMPPKKADALMYLDKNGPKPARNAKVILYRGDARQPHIMEYEVGPLPRPRRHMPLFNPAFKYDDEGSSNSGSFGSSSSSSSSRRQTFNSTMIPWHTRSPFADHEQRLIDKFIRDQMDDDIQQLLMQATDGYSFKNNSMCTIDFKTKRKLGKCLTWITSVPGQWVSKTHKFWVSLFKDLEGQYLHPIGLQFQVNAESNDPRRWAIEHVWWRGINFYSMERFVMAVRRRSFPVNIMRDPFDVNRTTLYSTANFRVRLPRWYRYAAKGPRTFLPDGRRYKVNGHKVEWQGWQFQFGVRAVTGIHVNDIRFRNERVVYELSLQEFLLIESGKSQVPLHTSIFDTVVNIGRSTYSMFPGIDCPHHATYFDMVQYSQGRPFVHIDAVCVFEHINPVPLRRHYETDGKGGYEWMQGMDDNVLIVRTVATIRTHGYMVDIVFHQNGGIDVRCSLTGYLIANYHTEADSEYGFQIYPNLMAPIQHHLVNFKVDLDILGLHNRVETLDIKSTKVPDDSEYGREYLYSTSFRRNIRRFEMDARTVFDEYQPKVMLFSNFQKTNRMGVPRSYRIQPIHTALAMPDQDWKIHRAASWSKYHIAVTKYNDSEQSSTSAYTGMDPFQPVVNFKSFIENNDRIEDEDLVAWVTLGLIHIPHTEDMPLINTQTTQMVFHITPYNYFDEDPSLISRDNIKVTPDWYGRHYYNYSGVYPWVSCTPPSGKASGLHISGGLIIPSIILAILTLL